MYDPIDEVDYSHRLAINYLREANEAFSRGDWRGTVAAAQLSAENAAKAIIAVYRIPSWSHDPSGELEDIMANLPGDLANLVGELAVIVRRLAPEHGRSTYGEPERGLTPWEIYSRGDAEAALGMARRAVDIMRAVLRALGIEVHD